MTKLQRGQKMKLQRELRQQNLLQQHDAGAVKELKVFREHHSLADNPCYLVSPTQIGNNYIELNNTSAAVVGDTIILSANEVNAEEFVVVDIPGSIIVRPTIMHVHCAGDTVQCIRSLSHPQKNKEDLIARAEGGDKKHHHPSNSKIMPIDEGIVLSNTSKHLPSDADSQETFGVTNHDSDCSRGTHTQSVKRKRVHSKVLPLAVPLAPLGNGSDQVNRHSGAFEKRNDLQPDDTPEPRHETKPKKDKSSVDEGLDEDQDGLYGNRPNLAQVG